MTLSESSSRTVHAIPPLPFEQLLRLKFINLKLGIQNAPADQSGPDLGFSAAGRKSKSYAGRFF
jgi:hypothetical protein